MSWLVEVVNLPLNLIITRVCFIEAVRNRNDIHKWCFFIIPDTTVSCCLKHSMKFYSGKYSCGRKLQFEFCDSEGIMCSIICSESAPSNHSEKIDLPLSICLYELKEIGCSCLYSLYYSEKKQWTWTWWY